MKAQEKQVKRRHPPAIFASLVQNVMKMPRMSGNVLLFILLNKIMTIIVFFLFHKPCLKKTFSAFIFFNLVSKE